MKCIVLILLFAVLVGTLCVAQPIPAYRKAILDLYYLGLSYEDYVKLGSNAWDVLVAKSNTWDQAAIDAAWSASWITLHSNDYWRIGTTEPATVGAASEDYTLYAGNTNLYVCVTNNWGGAGTNWLRAPLVPW